MTPIDCLELYEDAEFYDEEFAERLHEIPFYRRRAIDSFGPVLEVACGTGRITLPLAAEGVSISGLDASPSMIQRAKEKARTAGLTIKWYVQDVRAMALNDRFSLIFIATNALQHLHDLTSVNEFFSQAHKYLRPDGQLIIDVFNPSISKLARTFGMPHLHKTFLLQDGRRVDVEVDSEYLPADQILHFVLTYHSRNEIIRRKDVRMRCFFPEELIALCKMGGFDVVERFGDYDESSFKATSPKQLLVCRPPRSTPNV
jgi:SAM-dependent methyltransferase